MVINMKKKVAFICTHNSCRSIIAEGFAREYGSDILDIYSAGTEKYPHPKPLAIEVMEDIGIDMSHAKSKLIEEIPGEFDILITMGCGVECPYIPTQYLADWGLEDPSGQGKAAFEKTRDIIKKKVLDLIQKVRNNELIQKIEVKF